MVYNILNTVYEKQEAAASETRAVLILFEKEKVL